MSRGANQKLKLIYLMKILLEKTDDNHSLTLAEILQELARYDITAERKSIYADFESLRLYGIDIISEQRNRTVYYHVGSRDFEIAELKLLVDAVQSSKFITEKKSRQLIKKLEGFASKHEAKELHRQVYVQGRIKTMNESIYYNVDKIHQAIGKNLQIVFQYYQWNVNKEMELRHNGAFYKISPWELMWDDENYYLIAYDSNEERIKYFRVDKMLHIRLSDDVREGRALFDKIDRVSYSKKRFGMFDGEEQTVKIECENRFAGVIIDRFGKNVSIRKTDNEHFVVNVDVAVSGQFIGWLIALGEGVKVIGPESVISKIKDRIDTVSKLYESKI